MNYGYNIEIVQGGYILTHWQPNYMHGLALQSAAPTSTKYVFQHIDDLLGFLKQRLSVGELEEIK